jgi:hypothetical protein
MGHGLTSDPTMQPFAMTVGMRATVLLALALALLLSLSPGSVMGQEPESRLQGAYAVTIATEDVPQELIGGASLIGRWQITFGADGAYVLERQDVGALVRGQFQVDENRLVLRGETGVTACEAGPENDLAATYEWQIANGRLLLVAVEEPCARRRLLLTTRTLSPFVACPPLPDDRGGASGDGPPSGMTVVPVGTPVSATSISSASPAMEIDTLLKQMSDCWATRQPARFLRLLSAEYRTAQTPEDEDAERRFILNMGAPIVWDLAGEVAVIDDTHATATVRQTLGDTVDVVRYAFVFEDGSWRWDGTVADP